MSGEGSRVYISGKGVPSPWERGVGVETHSFSFVTQE